MRPEHKILIDFLNSRFEIFDLASLTSEHWATLVFEASRHRVAPLVYSKIKLAEAESMIPAVIFFDFFRFLKKYVI